MKKMTIEIIANDEGNLTEVNFKFEPNQKVLFTNKPNELTDLGWAFLKIKNVLKISDEALDDAIGSAAAKAVRND